MVIFLSLHSTVVTQDINCKDANGATMFYNKEAFTWIECSSGCLGYVGCETCCNRNVVEEPKAEPLTGGKLNPNLGSL